MRRILSPPVALVLGLSLVACGSPTLADGVTLETYIEAMAALRGIQDDSTRTPTAKQAARDSVLTAHDVTPAQLESAAKALAADPTRAFATWQAIERRVSGRDTVTAPPVGAITPASPATATPPSSAQVAPGGSATPR